MSLEARLASLDLVPDTPALLVELPVMDDNIERMAAAARAGGKDLRPHAKTHKIPALARQQLDAGAVGIQLAKLGEAEVFADAGIDDIFVGNLIVGDVKIRRLLDLAERITISSSVDSVAVASPIGAAAAARGMTFPVRIEIDSGQHRSGIAPRGPAVDLAAAVDATPGLRLEGVMTHQGHMYTSATHEELAERDAEVCRLMVETAELIRARGIECPVVSVGSTATSRFDALADGITEIRPGMYVFNDATVVGHGHASPEQTALWVVATVISRTAPDRAVIDAGSKVLSSDLLHYGGAPPIFGELISHPGHMLERLSEELGMIVTPPDSTIAVGDRVAIVPNHVCPVVNLADELLVAEDGALVDRWPVAARGRVT